MDISWPLNETRPLHNFGNYEILVKRENVKKNKKFNTENFKFNVKLQERENTSQNIPLNDEGRFIHLLPISTCIYDSRPRSPSLVNSN